MLLAIDTSSLVLSCALAEEGKLVAEWTQQKKLTHSEQLIPCMDLMLKEVGVSKKEITGIAVAKGPGSFTGLRIGLATAKMTSYTWKLLHGICTARRHLFFRFSMRRRIMCMQPFTGHLMKCGRKSLKWQLPLILS